MYSDPEWLEKFTCIVEDYKGDEKELLTLCASAQHVLRGDDKEDVGLVKLVGQFHNHFSLRDALKNDLNDDLNNPQLGWVYGIEDFKEPIYYFLLLFAI